MNGRARARGFGLMGFPLIWGLFRRVTIVEHLFLLEFLGLFRRIKFFTLSALEPRKMNQHKGILLGDKKFSENSSNKPTSSTHGHSSTPFPQRCGRVCATRRHPRHRRRDQALAPEQLPEAQHSQGRAPAIGPRIPRVSFQPSCADNR